MQALHWGKGWRGCLQKETPKFSPCLFLHFEGVRSLKNALGRLRAGFSGRWREQTLSRVVRLGTVEKVEER